MATSMYAEMFDNFQHSTRLIPENRSRKTHLILPFIFIFLFPCVILTSSRWCWPSGLKHRVDLSLKMEAVSQKGVTTQKANINIFTAGGTSNHLSYLYICLLQLFVLPFFFLFSLFFPSFFRPFSSSSYSRPLCFFSFSCVTFVFYL
jgi:hypothetical protein